MLYFVTWTTNYGLGAAVIKADSIDELKIICKNSNKIWDDYEYDLINTNSENGVLLIENI